MKILFLIFISILSIHADSVCVVYGLDVNSKVSICKEIYCLNKDGTSAMTFYHANGKTISSDGLLLKGSQGFYTGRNAADLLLQTACLTNQ